MRLGDGSEVETRVPRAGLPADGPLQLGLRPESVRVAGGGASGTAAKVELVERLGERTLVYARLADGQAITAEDEGAQPGQDRRHDRPQDRRRRGASVRAGRRRPIHAEAGAE